MLILEAFQIQKIKSTLFIKYMPASKYLVHTLVSKSKHRA